MDGMTVGRVDDLVLTRTSHWSILVSVLGLLREARPRNAGKEIDRSGQHEEGC